ncbi:hypothetical protein V8D89_004721 [Ganoderma adspersum]
MDNSAVPLDYDTFCRAFLSPPHIKFRPKRTSLGPFAPLSCANELPEDSLSQHFIAAVRTHHLTPGSTLTTVPFDAIPKDHEAKHRAHTAIYRTTDIPRRGRPHWAGQKVSFQFSHYVTGADPFTPSRFGEDCTETERERKRLREQVHATAELLFAAQQRVFLFMILIIGRQFRLLRWDHAGVIVTPSIDYVEQSVLLCDCLRRLSLLDDISLGFDPTTTRLRPGDIDYLCMDAAALDDPRDVDHTERPIEEGEIVDPFIFRYVRSLFRDTLSPNWPRYRLRIQDRDDSDTRDYLVCKPLHLPSGVVGRGTRGYVALDRDTQRFVWLKDAWSACDLVAEVEGDVLGRLNLAGVANVPTLVSHGHVQDQATVTSEWWEISHGERDGSSSREWTSPSGRKRKRDDETGPGGGDSPLSDAAGQPSRAIPRLPCPFRRHTHYRIAVEEIAMQLTEFRCGKQLASITLDCLHAHHQAATNHHSRLLHRDISSGNILIYPKVRLDEDGKGQSIVWTGMLTDWEFAKPMETERSSEANQVGTHHFMSVNLLCDPYKPAGISDELESFFHFLVYLSVGYLRSNCRNRNSWIKTYFVPSLLPAMYTGGGRKGIVIKDDARLTTFWPEGPLLFNSPMDQLLGELIKSFAAHYKVMAHDIGRASSPFSSSSSSSSGAASSGKHFVPTPCYSDDSDCEEVIAEWRQRKVRDTTPTPEERELARRVADHDFTLDFIAGLLRHEGWPDDDLIPVRSVLASDPHPAPKPEPKPVSVDTDTGPTPKRRRKAVPKKTTSTAGRAARRPSTGRAGTRNQTRAASNKARPKRRS